MELTQEQKKAVVTAYEMEFSMRDITYFFCITEDEAWQIIHAAQR